MSGNLQQTIITAIEDLKGQDLKVLDVTELSDVMDNLVIVTGTSNRHVKSVANNVIEECKKQGLQAIGVEGMEAGEWVLVDYGDTVVHVMLQATRDFYGLEKLWYMEPAGRKKNQSGSGSSEQE
ncbi:Ribosomal silencing factor RsfS [Thalassocella blandensis]|nr:Ribosomal silencing factor RsfS [Thalassocella blandensis]